MKTYNTPAIDIKVPSSNNPYLAKVLEQINTQPDVKTYFRVLNVIALDRLGITDHGPVHFQIVANIGLKLLRTLHKRQVVSSVENDYGLSFNHAELIVLLGSLLHDLGMAVERENHETHSLFLAKDVIEKLLSFMPREEQIIILSETLHAITSHRKGGRPITVEAGVVRVADALDMSHGRSRIPYEAGRVNIHSLSASAIEHVEITTGKVKPIQITIEMNNSSGLFQVDELLGRKLKGSGIEQHIEVRAFIKGDTEKSLLEEFYLKDIG